jgi:hypothetical protein
MKRIHLSLLSLLCAMACGGPSPDETLVPEGEPEPLRTRQALVQPSGTGEALMPAAMPDGTTVSIGKTEGEFAVSATGAATYRIPLEVPPGRQGMQPELAIVYDSHQKEGQLGVGFRLTGVGSSIHRCPKNPSRDGVLSPISWSMNDALCVDGEGLVLKSGSYFANLSEYRRERDEIEKVVQYGTPATHFRVFTKGGRILRYGSDGSCTSCNSVMRARYGVVRAWALEEIADRFRATTVIEVVVYQNDEQSYRSDDEAPANVNRTTQKPVGYVDLGPEARVALFLPRPDFDRLWVIAAADKVTDGHLVITPVKWRRAEVRHLSLASKPIE